MVTTRGSNFDANTCCRRVSIQCTSTRQNLRAVPEHALQQQQPIARPASATKPPHRRYDGKHGCMQSDFSTASLRIYTMAIAGFLVSMLASLLDPISVIGYVVAGSFIRRFWVSVLAGVLWRLLLQLIVVGPASKSLQTHAFPDVMLAALAGAAVATSLVYLIVGRLRASQTKITVLDHPTEPTSPSDTSQRITPTELVFKSGRAAVEYASKYLESNQARVA